MEKLDSKAVWIFFFRFLGVGLVLALILGWFFASLAGVFEFGFGWWIIILILLVVIWILGSYGWAKLYYNAYKFELTEEVFKKEKGVIWKKYISIPYGRIQNIDIHRGILVRILGLSDLMIQTAGYAGAYRGGGGLLLGGLGGREPEGRLPALSKERAEEIREELIRKAKGTKSGL